MWKLGLVIFFFCQAFFFGFDFFGGMGVRVYRGKMGVLMVDYLTGLMFFVFCEIWLSKVNGLGLRL